MYKFEVPSDYIKHLDHALIRILSLFPAAEIKRVKNSINVEYKDSNEPLGFKEDFKEELYNQLYRERIFQETLPIKKWLFSEPKSDRET
jgi:hypothetical protein